MSADPWLDVTIPSILDPDLAPSGAHVMSIYVHYTPFSLRHGDWQTSKDLLLQRVLATLEQFAPGVSSLVVAAESITPEELESQYGFHGGHVFHGELTLDQLATMRPLLGYGRYQRTCPWAVSVRRRHTPRWSHDRRQRKAGGPRDCQFIVVETT